MKKKDILFYTFLCIFLLTAIITLFGILEIIRIKSVYLNIFVGVFCVELAGAVIALFRKVNFFSEEKSQSKQEQPVCGRAETQSVSEQPLPEPNRCDLTAAEYFKKLRELTDRFHEKEEFVKHIHDHLVEWYGFVNLVSSHDNRVVIQLKETENTVSNIFFAHVPNEFRTKAFALQKNDLIVISGVLNTSYMLDFPTIEKVSFKLERKSKEPKIDSEGKGLGSNMEY